MYDLISTKHALKNRYRNAYSQFRANFSIIILFICLSLFFNMTAAAVHSSAVQQGIAGEVLRFHVLANSDSEEDQNIKYQIRDAVLLWSSEKMTEESQEAQRKFDPYDRDAVLQFFSENLQQIEETANKILNEQGMSYQAKAEIAWAYFPDRTYGECTFPAGWYQALRIRLGTAKGHNWWCLLYPALCFSDAIHAVVDEENLSRLEETLTVEEYETLLHTPSQWKISFRWKNF